MYININKLQIPEFVEFVSKYDILCFTETKLDESDCISTLLPVYTFFLNNRQKRLRSSGGIAIGIKSEYFTMTFNFTHHSEYMSWFSLHQEMTGLNEDLTVGVVYTSPIGSPYYKEDTFDTIEKEITY